MKETSIGDILGTIEDMIFIVNREGKILYANNAVKNVLKYAPEEVKDTYVFGLIPVQWLEEARKIFEDMFKGKRSSYTTFLLRKGDTLLPIKIRVWPGKHDDEQCLLIICKEITEDQEIIQHLLRRTPIKDLNYAVSSSVENAMKQQSTTTDSKGNDKPRILIVDDQLFNLKFLESALKEDYIVMTATNGKDALKLAMGKEQPDLILLDVIMPEMDGYEVCIRLREMPETKDIPVILVTALKSEKNEEYALQLGVVDYITKPFSLPIVKGRIKNHVEQKKYRDRQRENSYIDELTQIANRRKFNEYAQMEWSRAKRNGTYLSVIIIDVDLFKRYNDYYGHLEGDKCLYQIAQALKKDLHRSSDLVARWGGEEFVCILPETDRMGAIIVGERLRRAVAKLEIPTAVSEVDKVVTVSVGVSTMIPSDNHTLEELFRKADEAVYKAKTSGRNRVCAV